MVLGTKQRKTRLMWIAFLATALLLTAGGAAQAQLFSENFNSSSWPSGWTQTGLNPGNWSIYPSNNAGGAAYEIRFSWTPSNTGDFYCNSPAFNVATAGTYQFSFRQYIDHFGTPYTLLVEYSTNGGTNWTTGWTLSPSGTTPSGGELIAFNASLPVTSQAMIRFHFSGNSFNINYWYIDNVLVDFPPPTITMVTSPAGCTPPNSGQTAVANITGSAAIQYTAVWYRKNAGSWYSAGPTSQVGSNYTFFIDHAILGGVVVGDVVYWYLAAQDVNSKVSTLPAGGTGAGNPPGGSTRPASPFAYTIANVGTTYSIPYYENFDGAPAGYTYSGAGIGWRVGAPNTNIVATAYSGTNTLTASSTNSGTAYSTNETSLATSPVFNFSSATTDPVLTFWHAFDTEYNFDGCWVERSTNCGTTWTKIGLVNDPNGFNWYNITSSYTYCPGAIFSSNPSGSSSWRKSVLKLTGTAGQSAVQFRFRLCSDGSVQYYGWAIDDIAIGEFPQKDIEVADAQLTYAPNRWSQNVGETHFVKATVRNNGWEANPTSVTLTLTMPPNPPTTVTFAPTWSGNTAVYQFAAPVIPAVVGPISFTVASTYAGDMVPANDSKSRTFQIQTIRVFGFDQFENVNIPAFGPGWTVSNGAGAATWQSTAGFGATGNGATYPGDAVTASDWLISPPAYLKAGSSYRIRFKYRSRTAAAQILDLAIGTSPNPATLSVIESWNFSTATFTNALGSLGVSPFFNTDPSSDQNYYIAFRARSAAGAGALDIDDVILDENPTPPPKIGYGPVGTPQGQHIDNPSKVLKLTACFKKPGTIVKTFEVVSTTYNYGAPGDFLWYVTTPTPWITLAISTPDPRQYPFVGAPNGFNPPRPRQLQTFTMTVNPTGFAPGVYTGVLQFVGTLFNADFPNGVPASNQILNIPVEITVADCGATGGTPASIKVCKTTMTAPNRYDFLDPSNVKIASVLMKSGTATDFCITAYAYQLPKGIGRYKYIYRYWNISTSSSGWTADIDWYYNHSELLAGGVTYPQNLRCVRQIAYGGPWEDPTAGVIPLSDPPNYVVTGSSYNNNIGTENIAGNHALVTDYFPKQGADATLPSEFSLAQNYPNPFNPSTSIDFSVPSDVHVKIAVYNSLGEEVGVLVDETVMAGSYSTSFDASGLPSGTYIYRMTAGNFTETRRMLLSK